MVIRHLVPLFLNFLKMAIGGFREAPDSFETGGETLSSERFREETSRARREQIVGDPFD